LTVLKHALTPEERAYIAYCEWCDFLDLTPADLETWRKATKNLSETNYSSLPPRHAKCGRAGVTARPATRKPGTPRNANGAADET
jgi:hypothetical protein